jgi:hypothetical protein
MVLMLIRVPNFSCVYVLADRLFYWCILALTLLR